MKTTNAAKIHALKSNSYFNCETEQMKLSSAAKNCFVSNDVLNSLNSVNNKETQYGRKYCYKKSNFHSYYT